MHLDVLDRYGSYLAKRTPSLAMALGAVADRPSPIIVELGASRSFVSGRRPGVMDPDPRYWEPDAPQHWDWGAGIFSRVCAEAIAGTDAHLHTVDPLGDAISIARTITDGIDADITFHQTTSSAFLRTLDDPIDLLYMDHHETGEPGAQVHLDDARHLIDNELLADGAVILIDDVHVHGPTRERVEATVRQLLGRPALRRGKGTYSIPYLSGNGLDLLYEGYQVVLGRPLQGGPDPSG